MNIDYHALLPVEILASSILVVLVVDLFLPARAKSVSMWVAMVGVLASLAAASRSAARTWSTRSR